MVADTKLRERHIDLLRGLAILLIVALHSATILPGAGYEPDQLLLEINRYFILYRMPTLAFLSGLLLPGSYHKNLVDFAYGKLQRIAWPLLVWSIVYVVVCHVPLKITTLPRLLLGGSYLWYLSFILLYYLSAVVLRRMPALFVTAVLMTFAFMAPDGEKNTERLLYLAAIFYLGSLVGAHKEYWIAAVRSRWSPFALVPAAYFAWVMLGPDQGNYGPGDFFAACCFIVGASSVAYLLRDVRQLQPVMFVGEYSLHFYVIHFLAIYILANLCAAVGIASSGLVSMIVLPLSLAICALIVMASRKFAAVRLLFVGPKLPNALRERLLESRLAGQPR